MGITKIAVDKKNAYRKWEFTNSAREAWSEIIEDYKKLHPNGKILLPSYIGWSPNEGSGIFDSVRNAEVEFEFYSLDKYLSIQLTDLKEKVQKNKDCLVLLVHYFGFVDEKYSEITEWLDKNEVHYVEDCAHAWLTDLIGGKCGRNGKSAFYSLHKILPVQNGGIKVDNNPDLEDGKTINPFLSLGYDLFTIYDKRRKNYNYLLSLLQEVNGLQILYKILPDGTCPQTLPVILEDFDRNTLYHKMNDLGFGMVSLYHTMIPELEFYDSESSTYTYKNIINFPIHQDIDSGDLDELVENLKKVLNA